MLRGVSEVLSLVKQGDKVAVALSGGADSICLLEQLRLWQTKVPFQLSAVHIQHNLRGAESLRDENFCREFCKAREIPLEVFSVNVLERQKQTGESTELAARALRYEAFSKLQVDWIATAHTASDNLETFLFRFMRGSSLHGLTAIPVQNGKYIRPLLYVTRGEIEAYLQEHQLSYVTDSTNLTDDYTRNRIRHQVIPMLKQFNPSLEWTAGACMRSLKREDEYMQMQAEQALEQCRGAKGLTGLDALSEAIRFRCIALWLQEQDIPTDAQLLESLEAGLQKGGRRNLPGNRYAICGKGCITISAQQDALPQQVQEIPLEDGMYSLTGGKVLKITRLSERNFEKNKNVHKLATNFAVNCDTIRGTLFLTPRYAGDRVQLPKRNFTSDVKKLLQAAFPPGERKSACILRDDCGIVWLEGYGVVERCKPTQTTRHFLNVEVIQNDGTGRD